MENLRATWKLTGSGNTNGLGGRKSNSQSKERRDVQKRETWAWAGENSRMRTRSKEGENSWRSLVGKAEVRRKMEMFD